MYQPERREEHHAALHSHTTISNVADLDASLAFYEKALGLRRCGATPLMRSPLVYLGDGVTPHQLELTWLADRAEAYDLRENEFHLAFTVDDYAAAHALH